MPALGLLLLVCATASAADPPDPAAPQTPAQAPAPPPEACPSPIDAIAAATCPFGQVLDEAKAAYLNGDRDRALTLFERLRGRLVFGETVDEADAADALIYLGEVEYNLNHYEAATQAFHDLLQRNPDATINPYHHPPDVVAAFNQIKDAIARQNVPKPPPPPPPAPWWCYLPFGIPQFEQHQPGRGVLFGVADVLLSAVALGTDLDVHAHIHALNTDPPKPAAWQAMDRRLRIERYAVTWPTLVGAGVVWAVSDAYGAGNWRRHAALTVTVGPTSGQVDVGWRF